ncbi:MAG: ImmA/IrrE family metallo-endopeptidase [Chloroflexi bacterium]|nr:ImmA/IrrE family metallo-endopeptidase [Chloroflexota bacterium]
MTRQEAPINYAILKWARKQTDFTPEQAAARARIRGLERRGLTSEERLVKWESGEEKPTLSELELIAKAYRRPLLTFFLSEPPRAETRLQDFRTIGDRPVAKSSPEFAAFRRQTEALQKTLRELVEEEGGKPLQFIGSCDTRVAPATIAQAIRSKFGFSLGDQQQVQNSDELFNTLRAKAGEAGIFVLRKADLGSVHSRISIEEFRGLVISDPFAPLIVVNSNDARPALLFTLVHELAHLWLGESGISSFDALGLVPSTYQKREIFCNEVAAEFLVPKIILVDEWRRVVSEDLEFAIQSLADKFKVSRVVIARRLLDFQKITRETYWELYNQWRDEWGVVRNHQKEREGGPGYFVITKSKWGSKLLNTVIGAAYDGRLSLGDASKLLGIKVNYFNKFYEG